MSATGRVRHIVALGAHCDDIAIGAGATLLAACTANPGVRVDALVLTGGATTREDEERSALAAFCEGATLDVTVLKLPDGRVPSRWDEAKSALVELRDRTEPDLVLAPRPDDAHQDHRTLGELVPQVLRGPRLLGYEIVKWDGDLGRPNAYQPLSPAELERKVELLLRHYPSQRDKDWFDRETFAGLARIRGIECRARYAEAFHASKFLLDHGTGR